MASEIVYRDAGLGDVPQILDLWRLFWPPQPYEASLGKKIAQEPDLVCVAEVDARIAGTIIGGFDNWWAWIYRVAVHPKHQGEGIATGLFLEMHRRLAARGADAACLVASPSNDAMCKLLRKLGYQEKTDRRFSVVFRDGPQHGAGGTSGEASA